MEGVDKIHIIRLDCCKNEYCPECLFAWFGKQFSCPLCRAHRFSFRGKVGRVARTRSPMPVKEAVRLAVAGSVLIPIVLNANPAQGPMLVFLILFAIFVKAT